MTEDPAPYGSFSPHDPPPDPEARLRRVFEAAGCRTQVELAEVLGVRQSSVSDAKRRGSIPAEWLLKLLLLRGVHPAWVLTGHGPRRCACLSQVQARAARLRQSSAKTLGILSCLFCNPAYCANTARKPCCANYCGAPSSCRHKLHILFFVLSLMHSVRCPFEMLAVNRGKFPPIDTVS